MRVAMGLCGDYCEAETLENETAVCPRLFREAGFVGGNSRLTPLVLLYSLAEPYSELFGLFSFPRR